VFRLYLAARRTDSAKALAAKAIVLMQPENRAGEIVAGNHLSYNNTRYAAYRAMVNHGFKAGRSGNSLRPGLLHGCRARW
jgi:hypothetical protein